jgi:transposase
MIRLLEQHLGPLALATPPTPTQLEQTIEDLSQQIDSLQARLRKLESGLSHQRYLTRNQSKRISELEAGLALPVKDSHNSSLPPSLDAIGVKRTRSLRQPTDTRAGGQPGHAGTTRRLAKLVDEVVRYDPLECKHCKASLARSEALADESRQVIELPAIKPRVVEHRAATKRCSKCGRTTKGRFPKDVRASVRYGARVRAVAVYLSQYQLLPYERTSQLMRDLFGCQMSPATIYNNVARCAGNLSKSEGQIRGALLRSAVMHADETGLRVGKGLK